MEFSIVVAADLMGGIGCEHGIPWKIPEEIAWFKKKTTSGKNNAVIMGRKTWETLRGPLKDRMNIVLSRIMPHSEGIIVCQELEQALYYCSISKIDAVWVIGGAEVYKEALNSPYCKNIYLSRIRSVYPCTVMFPPIPPNFHGISIESESQWVLEVYRRSDKSETQDGTGDRRPGSDTEATKA